MRTPSARLLTLVALVVPMLTILVGAGPASAHESSDRSTIVVIDDERAMITAAVPFQQLGYADTSGDGFIDATELADQQGAISSTLVETARRSVGLSIDGQPVDIIGAGIPSISDAHSADDGAASAYVVLILATDTHDGAVTDVELDWGFIAPVSTVVLSHPDGVITGELNGDGAISFSVGTWASARSFVDVATTVVVLLVIGALVLSTKLLKERAVWARVDRYRGLSAPRPIGR